MAFIMEEDDMPDPKTGTRVKVLDSDGKKVIGHGIFVGRVPLREWIEHRVGCKIEEFKITDLRLANEYSEAFFNELFETAQTDTTTTKIVYNGKDVAYGLDDVTWCVEQEPNTASS